MTRCMISALLGALLLSGVGCSSQKRLDDLSEQNRLLRDQLVDLQSRLAEREQVLSDLQSGMDSRVALQAQLDAAHAARMNLEKEIERLRDEVRNVANVPALPAPIDRALAELAAQNPDLMSYDAKRGMIRFSSDLTFNLGSIEVNTEAKTHLSQLAQIINLPIAQTYEVRVVGHTDSVPVKSPKNVQKFEDNWGLSAWRAISVKRVLENSGVTVKRMGIAGYSKYRPVVANDPKRGARANRRVEIYLLANPDSSPALEATTSAPTPAPRALPTVKADTEPPDTFK